MTPLMGIVIQIYLQLLRLYPRQFQEEFSEEMLSDFSDMAEEMSRRGVYFLTLFYLREIIDFPINLLRIHYTEGNIFRILRSQPVNYGLRGAMGFGIGFASVTLATWQISFRLFSAFRPQIDHFTIWYFDTFHKEDGIFLVNDILTLILSAFTSVIFGVLIALLISDRSKFLRFFLTGALGLFIPSAISTVLFSLLGSDYYLNANPGYSVSQGYIVSLMQFMLFGAFLGLALSIAWSNHMKLLRFLVAGTVVYPLGVFLAKKNLYVLFHEINQWFFVASISLMLIIIGSVFIFAMWAERKLLWMVIAGALGYPISYHTIFHLAYDILRLPGPETGVGISPDDFIVYQFNSAIVETIVGLLFGLVLGLILGYQKKNNQPQITAGI